MKVIPFKKEHVEISSIRGFDVDPFLQSLEIMENTFSATFIKEDRIILFAGFGFLGKDIYCWIIPTIYFSKRSFNAIKILVQYMNNFSKSFKGKTLFTKGSDDPLIERFLTWLGFSYYGESEHGERIYKKEL